MLYFIRINLFMKLSQKPEVVMLSGRCRIISASLFKLISIF